MTPPTQPKTAKPHYAATLRVSASQNLPSPAACRSGEPACRGPSSEGTGNIQPRGAPDARRRRSPPARTVCPGHAPVSTAGASGPRAAPLDIEPRILLRDRLKIVLHGPSMAREKRTISPDARPPRPAPLRVRFSPLDESDRHAAKPAARPRHRAGPGGRGPPRRQRRNPAFHAAPGLDPRPDRRPVDRLQAHRREIGDGLGEALGPERRPAAPLSDPGRRVLRVDAARQDRAALADRHGRPRRLRLRRVVEPLAGSRGRQSTGAVGAFLVERKIASLGYEVARASNSRRQFDLVVNRPGESPSASKSRSTGAEDRPGSSAGLEDVRHRHPGPPPPPGFGEAPRVRRGFRAIAARLAGAVPARRSPGREPGTGDRRNRGGSAYRGGTGSRSRTAKIAGPAATDIANPARRASRAELDGRGMEIPPGPCRPPECPDSGRPDLGWEGRAGE